MNKGYVKPDIKISMFDVVVSTNDSNLKPISDNGTTNEMNSFINSSVANKVQRNIDFDKAIQFKTN